MCASAKPPEQELLRAAGLPYAELFDNPRLWMPRRRLEIDYFTPARLDDDNCSMHMIKPGKQSYGTTFIWLEPSGNESHMRLWCNDE